MACLVEKHSGMEWSGGVACSEVTDGVASCVTAAAVRIPASETLLASTGILPAGVLCVPEIPTVSDALSVTRIPASATLAKLS